MTSVAPEKPRDDHGQASGVLDAPIEVRVANLRAWKQSANARGESLSAVLEARLATLEAAAETATLDRINLSFRSRFPALQRWAAEIIRTRQKRTPLEVAAAYEVYAVQCEEVGQWELSARARDLAARQFTDDADDA